MNGGGERVISYIYTSKLLGYHGLLVIIIKKAWTNGVGRYKNGLWRRYGCGRIRITIWVKISRIWVRLACEKKLVKTNAAYIKGYQVSIYGKSTRQGKARQGKAKQKNKIRNSNN